MLHCYYLPYQLQRSKSFGGKMWSHNWAVGNQAGKSRDQESLPHEIQKFSQVILIFRLYNQNLWNQKLAKRQIDVLLLYTISNITMNSPIFCFTGCVRSLKLQRLLLIYCWKTLCNMSPWVIRCSAQKLLMKSLSASPSHFKSLKLMKTRFDLLIVSSRPPTGLEIGVGSHN